MNSDIKFEDLVQRFRLLNDPSGPLRNCNNCTKTCAVEANPDIKSVNCCWLHNLCSALMSERRDRKRSAVLKWKMSRLAALVEVMCTSLDVVKPNTTMHLP